MSKCDGKDSQAAGRIEDRKVRRQGTRLQNLAGGELQGNEGWLEEEEISSWKPTKEK